MKEIKSKGMDKQIREQNCYILDSQTIKKS